MLDICSAIFIPLNLSSNLCLHCPYGGHGSICPGFCWKSIRGHKKTCPP